ncbi:hypothetical protein V6N11_050793 [Hibiscus sabdariffa]|uniref:pectinesterase n=1 Tax=Hibiscus sabdariffa TaxID=183260 RepID=A0ABR2TAX4_9ROSI
MQGAQVVALRVAGDGSAINNCNLYGFQDTLCDDRGNHFYKNCNIRGLGFICGTRSETHGDYNTSQGKFIRGHWLLLRARTVYYGEYKCTGEGSSPSKRVPFAKKLTDKEAKQFITLDFISATIWLLPPPTI